MKPDFLKDNVPNLDLPYIDKLSDIYVKPVFIMGLHRSGTTFLYETLSELLPVASLTVYHLAYYRRLLKNNIKNTEDEYKSRIDNYFRDLGFDTRPTDGIKLSADTVEEYGWLLLRYCKKTHINKKTVVFFAEICKKLLFLDKGKETVLLKSPWDTGEGYKIHKLFPEARFIYIKRDPVKILNSQFKNSILFGSSGDPFLMFLLTGSPLGRTIIKGQQLLYKLVGEKKYRKIMLSFLIKDIKKELQRYKKAVESLSEEVMIELDYDELMENPAENLTAISKFLGMNPVKSLGIIKPRPRNLSLYPEIEAKKDILFLSHYLHL